MEQDSFNDLWKLMGDYRFKVHDDQSNDIICTICRGLIINAHSSPCGCLYCFECIKKYADGQGKKCPGKTGSCKEEMININGNLVPDHRINRKITRTIVKCPESNCTFVDELRNMEDHIRVCDARPVDCPFMNVGCKDMKIVKIEMKNHFLEEIVSHSKIMLESMENVRNEVELLTKNVRVLTNEKKNLEEKIVALEADKSRKETFFGKYKFSLCSVPILGILIFMVIQIQSQLNEMGMNLSAQAGGEFVWKITDWNMKINNAKIGLKTIIYSYPFYSYRNGYKIVLIAYPNGNGNGEGTHVGLFFSLMRGEFDDMLSWPFDRDITFELIDQRSKQVHTSMTIKPKYESKNGAFEKPTSEQNYLGFGFSKFIALSDLANQNGLNENNEIFIRCRVS